MIKKIILQLLKIIIPMKNIIIFESYPDFSDNSYYIFKYLVEKYNIQDKFKLVWFVYDYEEKKRAELLGVPIICVDNNEKHRDLKTIIRRLYYNYSAKVIFDSNIFVKKARDKQIRIYMVHGMPIKEASEYQSKGGECDLFCVSGEFFIDTYKKYTNPESIKVYGLTRDEPLYDVVRKDVKEKKIIWMPTYRQHRGKTNEPDNLFPFGVPVIKTEAELKELNEYLKERDMFIMFRLHPAQDNSIIKSFDMSNIVICDNEYLSANNMMLEDFLADSDALITDYSSVYYDYLYTGNPIGLTFEDVDEYTKTMKLVFKDIKNELPGRKINSMDDLYKFIDETKNHDDKCKEQRDEFMKKIGMKKFPTSELVAQFMFDKLNK